jgi:hypothetical protein
VRLKETDWDAPGGAAEVEVEYPDAPIIDLVNWLRKTSAWIENPELVERRVRRLNGILADHRNRPPGPVGTTPTVVPAGFLGRLADPVFRAEVERALKEYKTIQAKANRVAALERARDAKQAKRAAAR